MKKILFVSVTLVCLILSNEAESWNDKITHADMSEYAAKNSALGQDKDDYLKQLGFNKGLDDEKLEWAGKNFLLKIGSVKVPNLKTPEPRSKPWRGRQDTLITSTIHLSHGWTLV